MSNVTLLQVSYFGASTFMVTLFGLSQTGFCEERGHVIGS